MPLTSGSQLGVFTITGPIGVGGMGEVYQATDTNLKRQVAIKVLPASVAGDADRLARFQREAEVLAALNHPHIAAIYGLEKTPDGTALVMELVEGDDLSQRIARGAIPIDEALPIAKQIAEALEAAHEQGIIHRDLKPANIKVRPDGTVKVLDFGLAKAMEPAAGSSPSVSPAPTITTPALMTGVGMILGTAAYMSPEQARGKIVDKRADIWAFGAVLYEVLTGQRAFGGDDVSEVLSRVLQREPDWAALPSGLSSTLVVYLKRCLHKDVKQRIGDIHDVRLALEGAFDTPASQTATSPVPIATPVPRWKRLLPVAAALVAGIALGAYALAGAARGPSAPGAVTRFTISLGEGQQFTNTGRNALALSPDGAQMVYVANQRLFLRSMSSPEARPIQGTEFLGSGVTYPAFSPDGSAIVFWANDSLKRIATTGGVAVTLCPAESPRGVTWNGDTIMFGQGGRGVFHVSANGGQPEQVIMPEPGEAALGPQLLPGGRTVLFTLGRIGDIAAGTGDTDVVVQSLETGERRTLVEAGRDGRYLPSGHLTYISDGVLFAAPFDPERLVLTSPAKPVVEGVSRAGSGAHAAVSDNGTLVYLPGPAGRQAVQQTVALFDRSSGSFQPLKVAPAVFDQIRVSPDGRQVAFGTGDRDEAIVWIYDLVGTSAARRLTFEGRNRYPVWSGDGQRLAFQSDRQGDFGIFWQRADGTGVAERLTRAEKGTEHIPTSWSPDNTRLLYDSLAGGVVTLMAFSAADGRSVPFGDVTSPAPTLTGAVFSPDGRWVAYASTLGNRTASAVFVQPFPATGARYQVSKNVDDAHHQVWTPDGAELLFTPGSVQRLTSVRITAQPTFSVGEELRLPRPSLENRAPASVRNYDISHDGRHIIGTVGSQGVGGASIQVVLNWFEELTRLVPTK